MAHRALLRCAKNVTQKLPDLFLKKEVSQNFKNLLVLDFEATCVEGIKSLSVQEIIEFPCVVLSTEDWKVKDVFHEYIKPKVHPELSHFCIDLTGILQDMVDNQPHFSEVFENFNQWLKEGEYLKENNKSAFVTSGDWDLKVMLPNQCKLDGIPVPDYFREWIDLKKTFCHVTNKYPRGIKNMASVVNIPFTGKLHSGINDVHNMVRIITKLQKLHQVNFTVNSFIDKQSKIV